MPKLNIGISPDAYDELPEFYGRIFRPSAGEWVRCLLNGHPTLRDDHWIYIRGQDGAIVSSMCLIPQQWTFAGILLAVGQVELVATDPRYRGQGCLRQLMSAHDEVLKASGTVLSCVQGLPGLYEHFGYHYAIPLKGGLALPAQNLPEERYGWEIRPAVSADIPMLVRCYDQACRGVCVRSVRTDEICRYQENQSPGSEHADETFVVQRDSSEGYFRLARPTKGPRVLVREIGVSDYEAFLAVLAACRQRAETARMSEVTLQLPSSHAALKATGAYGGHYLVPYGWQVRILDWRPILPTDREGLVQPPV